MNEECIVLWIKVAINDLNEIIEYIAHDSVKAAIEKLEQIEEIANSLKTYPNRGRVIPELMKNNIIKYRELIINPWRIFYNIEKGKVYVHAVIDGRRNIEDILLKRKLR